MADSCASWPAGCDEAPALKLGAIPDGSRSLFILMDAVSMSLDINDMGSPRLHDLSGHDKAHGKHQQSRTHRSERMDQRPYQDDHPDTLDRYHIPFTHCHSYKNRIFGAP